MKTTIIIGKYLYELNSNIHDFAPKSKSLNAKFTIERWILSFFRSKIEASMTKSLPFYA